MLAPRKYPDELRERATRLAVEARRDPQSGPGAVRRIADQLGMHPEALRTWVKRTEIDQRVRGGPRRMMRPGSPSWNGKSVSCDGPIRS